jgi:Ca2+-dependent lipid-binding protein
LKLYLLGPKSGDKIGEVKTKTIKKTLNPVWDEEYHFPIKSFGTDVLHMSLKDWNAIGKDDPISKYD